MEIRCNSGMLRQDQAWHHLDMRSMSASPGAFLPCPNVSAARVLPRCEYRVYEVWYSSV